MQGKIRIRKPPAKAEGPLWEHAASIAEDLAGQGYAQTTIRIKLWLVARLSRWMAKEGLSLAELSPAALRKFEAYRWQRPSHRRKCSLAPILRYLRRVGEVPEPTQPFVARPVEELLNRYREHLVIERGVARTTLIKYEHVARLFLDWHLVTQARTLEQLDGASVTKFIAQECRNCPVGAAKNRVKGMRQLLRFLHQEGLAGALVDAVPTVAGWRDAQLPKGLEARQVEQLLASCDKSTVAGRRDGAILLLLARMGLRAGEVSGLELRHFDWPRGEVVIPGKGGREERLPLPPDVGEALAAYILGGRPQDPTGRLFRRILAPRGNITVESVKEVVRRACQRVGIAEVGPHCLRHSLASETLAAGASLVEVGQLLRHRELSTTAVYAKVDRTRLRELARPWPGDAA